MADKQNIEILLRSHREEIDAIDAQIITLLNQRAERARAIGQIKGSDTVYRPEREAQVLRQVQKRNKGPLSDESVTRLFREIMSVCLALERPLTVTYLGPGGVCSEAAALKHFGHAANLLPCASIDEAFCIVEVGEADYVMAPLENSMEGAVGRTLDLMISTSLSICGEVILPMQQSLLRIPHDTTRFWILGHESIGPSGYDKTSLILSTKNKPGAMRALIALLARHKISMTRLQSHPSSADLWESVFFIDLDGHQQAPHIHAALTELDTEISFVKVLGSYPWAVL